jgi:hypothetical protein
VVTAFGGTFGYVAVERVTAGPLDDAVIPSGARDLLHDPRAIPGHGPSLRSG